MLDVGAGAVRVDELWVYPVKACQGIPVESANVTATGLEFDRTWCIVDLNGTHVPKLEAMSGRRMPVLATIRVQIKEDTLYLDAPGMEQLKLPTATEAYSDCPSIKVESAGATAGGPWSLAFLECKLHQEGSMWITKYLNSKEEEPALSSEHLRNGKKTQGSFALVRSLSEVVDLADYPPIFPLLEKSKTVADYKSRFQGNYRRLSDFAPFLLVSKSSARFLATSCKEKSYPTHSFRGNIVVDGKCLEPWAEESWAELKILGDQQELSMHTIKACPRCTVPCRDQTTGKFLFSEKLKLWKILKSLYPQKFHDAEWGSWAGAYMGVYMGHHGATGRIAVGDTIVAIKITPWDAHITKKKVQDMVLVGSIICVAVAAGALMAFQKHHRVTS